MFPTIPSEQSWRHHGEWWRRLVQLNSAGWRWWWCYWYHFTLWCSEECLITQLQEDDVDLGMTRKKKKNTLMNVLIEIRHGLEVKVSERRHYGYENNTLITLAVYIQHKYSHLKKKNYTMTKLGRKFFCYSIYFNRFFFTGHISHLEFLIFISVSQLL